MAAKSQDPMLERVKRILQFGGANGSPMVDLPAGAGATDLETLFLAELRNRRERLAQWMQVIQEEVRREAATPLPRSAHRPRCRTRAPRPANAR